MAPASISLTLTRSKSSTWANSPTRPPNWLRQAPAPSAAELLLYGAILANARAMGEFGAVSVVSGHIRGLTNTMPLHVEILYNEYDFVGAFAVASLLAGLAIVTLVAKSLLEWRYGDRLAAGRKH